MVFKNPSKGEAIAPVSVTMPETLRTMVTTHLLLNNVMPPREVWCEGVMALKATLTIAQALEREGGQRRYGRRQGEKEVMVGASAPYLMSLQNCEVKGRGWTEREEDKGGESL